MLTLLAMLVGLGCIICWIIVLIKIFTKDGALKGILGIICPLFAFILGWMNADSYGVKNIMLLWTALVVISLILNFVFGAAMIPYGTRPVVTP
jgi:hypothetical protein